MVGAATAQATLAVAMASEVGPVVEMVAVWVADWVVVMGEGAMEEVETVP